MKSFDAVIVTDTATFPTWSRGYGAHRVASHLRMHGFSVLVIDFSSELTFELWEEICEHAISDNTKLVGFSTTWWPYRLPFQKNEKFTSCNVEWVSESISTPNININSMTYHAIQGTMSPWIDIIKKKNKKTKIILGGPKIEFYKDFPADFFINGLGENQIMDFLSEPKRIWPKFIQHDINSNNKDWGWKTSSTTYSKYDQINSNEIFNIEIARGCKFKCNFCSFPLIGQKDVAGYLKEEESIYREIMSNYDNFGITKYFIADDTFNDSIEKLEMMVRVRNRLPFDFKTKAYIRADIIATQPKQIELLHETGLASCYIGIESFHPLAGKFAGKGMDPTRRKQALYDMHSKWGDDVSINGGYMIGLPGEDEKFLREQAEWFAKSDCPVNYGVSFIGLVINPWYPGSLMYPSEIDKDPEKFGYLIPDKEKPYHWVKNDGTDITTYKRAHELAVELNTKVWTARGPRIDNVDYKLGTISDPRNNYFTPLIEMLKHG